MLVHEPKATNTSQLGLFEEKNMHVHIMQLNLAFTLHHSS